MDLIAIVSTSAFCAGLVLATLVLSVERKLVALSNHPRARIGELRRARLIRQRSLRAWGE